MSLSTYDELLASVATWLTRTDLTAMIPDFVALAEAEMNTRIEHRDMVTVSTISVTGETYTLPSGFAGVLSLRVNTAGRQTLDFLSMEAFDELPVGQAGSPQYYTIAAGNLVFWPAPAAATAMRLRYRATLPALVTNSTNWLLTRYPNAYLFGALMQTAPFLKDDQRVSMWAGLFDRAIENLNTDGARQSLGAVLQTQSGITV